MPKKKKAARERSLLLSGQPLVLSGYAVLVLFIEENKGNDFHVLGTRVGERVFLAFGTDGHITGAYLYLCAVVVVSGQMVTSPGPTSTSVPLSLYTPYPFRM